MECCVFISAALNRICSKPEFAGLIIHGQHIFHGHIGHDAVVRAANVATVFSQHPDALTDFPADIVCGSEGQGCLGGNFSEKRRAPLIHEFRKEKSYQPFPNT